MEEDNNCAAFYLTMAGAFLAGTGLGLYHHLQWWSLLFGLGSLLLAFCIFLFDMAGTEPQKPQKQSA